MQTVSAKQLETFIASALERTGMPAADAQATAELMADADMHGADGHGVFRLPQYVRRIQAGGINLRPNIRLIEERPGSALVDGDNGMGHLVMKFAAETAIAAAAMPITNRRSRGHGKRRNSGRARQTTASDPSSATFAEYSVIVGAIITPATRPSETGCASWSSARWPSGRARCRRTATRR